VTTICNEDKEVFLAELDKSFEFVVHFLKVFFSSYFKQHEKNYLSMYACLLCNKGYLVSCKEMNDTAATVYHLFLTMLLQVSTNGEIVNEDLAKKFSVEFQNFVVLLESTQSHSGCI